MTCVVAMITKFGVVMGADSAGVSNYDVQIRADEKIFIKNKMIFGFTSSFRMGQILRYDLEIPKHAKGMDDYEYMVAQFIPAVRKCLFDGGFLTKNNNNEMGGVFLVGYKKKIYKVEADFQVGRRVEKYDVCGSGEDVALGSLYTTTNTANWRKRHPSEAIKIALQAAARFKTTVAGPFKIREL